MTPRRSGLVAFLARELQATLKGEGTRRSSTCAHDRAMRNGQNAPASPAGAAESRAQTRGLAGSI
jgi:hypothetical protein